MSSTDLDFDPTSADALANPYPYYRALREADPVHHDEANGVWLLTRHADVQSVLRSPAWGCDHRESEAHKTWVANMGGAASAADDLLSKVLLFMDPPDHT